MDWILIAILSVIVIVYLLRKLSKKNFPPGPRSLPILGHFHLLGKNPHQDLHRLARKYGPIMGLRFGFVPTVVISSPDGAELVLKTHDLIFANRPKSQASECLSYGQRNLIFGPYSPYWRNMRKLCTLELLSNLRISKFQPMRRAELELFVSSLKSATSNGGHVAVVVAALLLLLDRNVIS